MINIDNRCHACIEDWLHRIFKHRPIILRLTGPIVEFIFHKEILSIRKRWHPSTVDESCVPADMVNMQMGANHHIDIFRLISSFFEFFDEVGLQVVKCNCTRPLFVISTTRVDDDRQSFGFNKQRVDRKFHLPFFCDEVRFQPFKFIDDVFSTRKQS